MKSADSQTNDSAETVVNDKGQIISVSDGWRRLAADVNLLLGDLEIGTSLFEHPHCAGRWAPQIAKKFAADLHRVIKGQSVAATTIYPASTLMGEVKVELTAVRGPSGVVVRQSLIELDPADQAQEDRLKAVMLESLGEAVMAVDFDANVTYVNRLAEQMYGFTLAEVYGESAAGVSEADITEEKAKQVVEQLRSGRNWTGSMLVTTRTGRTLPVRAMTSPIRDRSGTPVGIISILQDISDLAEANQALIESKKQYEDLFEASPIPMWVYDVETLRFLMVNHRATETYGYSKEEFLNMTVRDIRPPEDLPRLEQALSKLATVDRTLDVWRHRTKSGEILDVEVSSDRLPFRDRPARLAVAKDVTESRKLQASLLRKNKQQVAVAELGGAAMRNAGPGAVMRLAVESVAEIFEARLSGVLQLEPDGNNFRLVASTGWRREHVGTIVTSMDRGAQAAYTLQTQQPVIVEDFPTETRFENRHIVQEYAVRSGMSTSIQVDGTPWGVLTVHTTQSRTFTDEDIHFLKSVANIISVSIQRHRADEAIRQSRERFEYAAHATADAIWDWDLEAGTLWWSDGMEKLFGYRPAELEPGIESWSNRVHPDDAEWVTASLDDVIASDRQSWSAEYQFRRKDGTYAIVHDRGFVIRDENGHPIRMVGGMEDVSLQVEAEERQRFLESQLRESQKMEAIGTLAGGIAHDFNNILGAILGNAELARQDAEGQPQVQESLSEILKAANRAKDLVQQILSFSRRQPTERHVIDLAPVVEEAVRLLRATVPARIQIETQFEPETPPVHADATQIQQVVLNLGTNAYQAFQGKSGLIRFEVGQGEVVPGTSAAVITVTDTGSGIDRDSLTRLFEPFFTTKPVGEGTGLGLSVVHGIVTDHGGTIHVESEVGKGTKFIVSLPAAEGQVEPVIAELESAAASGSGQRILHIDDDEALVHLVDRMLARRGYRVEGYTDYEAALDRFRAEPDAFDLVVTDYNMPGTSGIELAHQIRSIRANMPVAISSGYITEDLREQAEGLVAELIFKPNTVDEYCAAVQRILDSTRKTQR